MRLLPHQRPPAGQWSTWLVVGGRGSGTTTAGAAWLHGRAMSGDCASLILLAPTYSHACLSAAEGESSIVRLAPAHERPAFSRSRSRLTWPNGAVASLFSSEDADRLRGIRADAAWAEQMVRWTTVAAWEALQDAMSRSARPQIAVTTLPPHAETTGLDIRLLMNALRLAPGTVVTRASTNDNPHLASSSVERLTAGVP